MFRHKIGVIGATFALLFFTIASVWPGGPTRVGAEEPKESRLKELLKEKLSILKEVAAELEKAAASGQVSVEQTLQATEAVLRAELDLCESDKERIPILEKLVAAAK